MAITIRTGANGSYKSAYTSYFTILAALKAGKVVVTNIEGMQPLKSIEKRLNITFPSTAKLIRVTSRDKGGIYLWTHFFCWCPIGATIVIDECQDIFSKNIGFDMKKVFYKPLEEFITKDGGKDGLLPESYVDFFYSRYIPADMQALEESEVDDRGIAEYDEQGRIIYPHTFNEGFMRHRKYNWDIELLSPDWKQIDTAIRACGEQNFFHRGRDQFFWAKRKPYIFRHDNAVATPVIPRKKDVNLTTQKIPLDAFLIYKSTSTGAAKEAGAMNLFFRSPKAVGVFLLFFACVGYLIYALSGMVFGGSESVEESQAATSTGSGAVTGSGSSVQSVQNADVLPNGGSGGQTGDNGRHATGLVTFFDVMPFEGVQKAFLTSTTLKKSPEGIFDVFLTFDVVTDDGVYSVNERFLAAHDVRYSIIDHCLIELSRGDKSRMLTCPPNQVVQQRDAPAQAEVKLLGI